MRVLGGKLRSSKKSRHPLARALKGRGMSQRALAMEAGISPAVICRVLTGRESSFTARQAEKLWSIIHRWPDVTLESLVFTKGW